AASNTQTQDSASNTQTQDAASNTQIQDAASNTQTQDAAPNTSAQNAAQNTPTQDAASNTPTQDAAPNTSAQNAASNTPTRNVPAQNSQSQNRNTQSQTALVQNTQSQNAPTRNTQSQNAPARNTQSQNAPAQNTQSQDANDRNDRNDRNTARVTPTQTPVVSGKRIIESRTTTMNVCDDSNCTPDPPGKVATGKVITSTMAPETAIATITPINQNQNQDQKTITTFHLTSYTSRVTQVFPGYTTVVTTKDADGQLISYTTYYPPSTVVLLQLVTDAVADDQTDPLGISGSSRNNGLF
ncbi:19930_t:CDS:2, partial [Gigaspora rosea]